MAMKTQTADLTAEDLAAARKKYEEGEKCAHCGGLHLRACPRVKRMVFEGGKISEVEFWPHNEWPKDDIIWPEELYENDEERA